MTRFILLPILLCIPLLSHPQTKATKEALLVAPAESPSVLPVTVTPASAPAPSSDTTNAVRPVFQGVVAPKLLYTIPMKEDGNQHVHIAGRQRVVTVFLTVNEAGQPTELNIPEPVDDALDVEVLATIGKFRYRAGTLNGKVIPMMVRMRYVVPVGAIY